MHENKDTYITSHYRYWVLPLIGATGVISYSISERMDSACKDQVAAKLVAVREMKHDQLGSYFDNLKTITRVLR